MEQLQKTINDSCLKTYNSVKRLDEELVSLDKLYQENVATALNAIQNNPDVKLEDVEEPLKVLRTTYVQQEMLKDSVRAEITKFQTLYLLSQATDEPVKIEGEFLNTILSTPSPLYVTDGRDIICMDPAIEKEILDRVSTKEMLQKEFDSAKSFNVQK